MAEHEHEQPEKASGEHAATPNETPKLTSPTETSEPAAPFAAKSELPEVEAPSISPAAPEPVVESSLESAIPLESESPIAPAPRGRRGFPLGARGRRNALLAASVALAAGFGAVAGGAAGGGFFKPAPAPANVASLQEREAMQQSITHLSKEIATLKASVEAANRSSHSQFAKISERLARERAEITGSISAPRTTQPAAAPAPASAAMPQPTAPQTTAAQTAVPIPTPRLPQRMAALENPQPAHRQVVAGWTLRAARDGLALIEGRGEIFQVERGVPVPGLGRVEEIKREDGRWMVVTARGIIVSQRDRRYFEGL